MWNIFTNLKETHQVEIIHLSKSNLSRKEETAQKVLHGRYEDIVAIASTDFIKKTTGKGMPLNTRNQEWIYCTKK